MNNTYRKKSYTQYHIRQSIVDRRFIFKGSSFIICINPMIYCFCRSDIKMFHDNMCRNSIIMFINNRLSNMILSIRFFSIYIIHPGDVSM